MELGIEDGHYVVINDREGAHVHGDRIVIGDIPLVEHGGIESGLDVVINDGVGEHVHEDHVEVGERSAVAFGC